MEKLMFKPSTTKILSWGLVFGTLVLAGILVLTWEGLSGLSLGVIGSLWIGLFLFLFVFFRLYFFLPFFRVELDGKIMRAPKGAGFEWKRAELALKDIDLDATFRGLKVLGFYVYRTHGGESVSVWALTDKQMEHLEATIKAHQA